jgi:hypothetical protein
MRDKCIEQKTKKYTSRSSPPYSANECKNEIKNGNNGKPWKSVPNKHMIYKWIPILESSTSTRVNTSSRTKKNNKNNITKQKGNKTYYIHDNGGRPFKVIVNHNKKILIVYIDTRTDDDLNNDIKPIYDKIILETKYKKFWNGGPIPKFKNRKKQLYSFEPGNSILISTNIDQYIYIGSEIYSFQTGTSADEQIENYISLIGNNDVPYPFATSKKYTYLMIENVYIENELLHRETNDCDNDCKVDAYCLYYGYCDKQSNEIQKLIQKNAKPIKNKIIQKRL